MIFATQDFWPDQVTRQFEITTQTLECYLESETELIRGPDHILQEKILGCLGDFCSSINTLLLLVENSDFWPLDNQEAKEAILDLGKIPLQSEHSRLVVWTLYTSSQLVHITSKHNKFLDRRLTSDICSQSEIVLTKLPEPERTHALLTPYITPAKLLSRYAFHTTRGLLMKSDKIS